MVSDLAGLRDLLGTDLGCSEWAQMPQELISAFADVTGDHNYIHIDAERARETPYGTTIAHGYLTLSLLAPILQGLLTVTDSTLNINYGLDRVRFPAPVRSGARYRGCATLREVTEIEGGVQVKLEARVEVEGESKPAAVAECLFRYYA